MAEEAVLTEEEQAAAEAKAAEDKAAEEQAAKEAEEAAAAEEKSSLEKREEEIRLQEEAAEKEEEETSESIEDLDMDGLKEKHGIIDKLKLKTDSVVALLEDVLTRYEGGLEDFQRDSEIRKELKELGYETKAERDELFKKMHAKEEIKPPEKGKETKETTEKTFAETRRENLAQFLPQQTIDAETEEPRALTEEEKNTELDRTERFANSIMPSHIPDTVGRVEAEATNLRDDFLWFQYQCKDVLNGSGGKLLPDSLRAEIIEHSKRFPKTYMEIVEDAFKRGVNPYGPVHHHFLTHTKKDLIEAEQKKRWEEERDKEEKKKADAKTETVKKAVPSGASKSQKDMTLKEREQYIRDLEKSG